MPPPATRVGVRHPYQPTIVPAVPTTATMAMPATQRATAANSQEGPIVVVGER